MAKHLKVERDDTKAGAVCGTIDDLLRWPILARLGLETLDKVTRAHVYHNGGEAIIVDRDDDVFIVTRSSHGVIEKKKKEFLCGQRICRFFTGNGEHTLALSESGVLYGWGSNSYGQLAGENISDTGRILEATNGKKVMEAAGGVRHTVVLTAGGEVWSWGDKDYTGTRETSPKVLSVPKCAHVSVSGETSAALTRDGSLFMWGENSYGQTSVSSKNHCISGRCHTHCPEISARSTRLSGATLTFTPTKVRLPHVVLKVCMGSNHVIALTDDGKVHSWGRNDHDQLGRDAEGGMSSQPQVVVDTAQERSGTCIFGQVRSEVKMELVKFVDITAEEDMSAALSEQGHVYIWGSCGVPKTDRKIPVRTSMKSLDEIAENFTRNTLVIQGQSANRYLEWAFDNDLLSDCKFLVMGETIHAQKAVLVRRSEYFETMFNGEWKESDGKINISQHSYSVYKSLIRYLYTDKVESSDEELLPLLQLAHETINETLINRVVEKLRFKLYPNNILDIFQLASVLDMKLLLGYCRQFAKMSLKNITKVECDTRPELLTKLVVFVVKETEEDEEEKEENAETATVPVLNLL